MNELLTYETAARKYGLFVSMLRRATARRSLRCIRLGHRTVVLRPVDIERWLKSREQEALS